VTVSPLEEPSTSGTDDKIFITRSYDSTSHFETVVDDIHDVWRRVTGGKKLELKKREEGEGAQVQE
jgi:Rab GDP dissociation inhibitor